MTWCFIIAYDLWNFEYTYNNLTTHAFYCGVALLLAPTFANMFWNKGGWIQNRANTLAIWCMFAQVFPLFQDHSKFSVLPVLYKDGVMNPPVHPTAADPHMMGIIAVFSIVINVVVFTDIWKRAIKQHINPYLQPVFVGTRDYDEAMARS